MTQVVPAIIPHTKEQIEEEVRKVSDFAELIQIDISDGVFTPVKTWPYNERDKEYFSDLVTENAGWPSWDKINYEIHLMIKNPEEEILNWIRSGATGIVVHIEAVTDMQKIIDICKEHFISLGVAIKPRTDIEKLKDIVHQVDFIQCMGSDMLGKHGVSLDEKAVERIKTLRSLYPESIIAIDIGVTTDNAESLVEAGISKLIVGSAILNSISPKDTYTYLSQIE